MAAGNYFTTAGPETVGSLVVQAESRVTLGTERLWGALEYTSGLYALYSASIGLQSGKQIDLGELSALGMEHVPTFEIDDAANVLRSSLEFLSEEETTITTGIKQWNVNVLQVAVGTGVMYEVGDERLITVGGKCTTERRPLVIEAVNIYCQAPSSPVDVLNGITACVITAYDCQCSSGLPLSEIVGNAINAFELEWTVHPVTNLALGNRRFNMYIF